MNSEVLNMVACPLEPLQPLLLDDEVTEILLHGEKSIYFERFGILQPYSNLFQSCWNFERAVQRILEDAQVKVDLENPFASFSWKEFRVHISLSPLAKDHTVLTLRRTLRKTNYTLSDLRNTQSLTEEQHLLLKQGIEEKKNILVIGGTGSGKTTLLSALLKELSEITRVVILEDTDEVQPPNDLSPKLLTREASPLLKPFELGDLLKQSLRMRPDRLVVGEVRGGEAKDLLMSLSTGHHGSFATLHASSAPEALLRLEMLVQMGAAHWSVESIRKLISLTVNWIVVMERKENRRMLEGVYEITSLESVGFLTQKLA